MPVYEYQCNKPKCRFKFEVLQRMDDHSIKDCPQCMNESVERLISCPGLDFKGKDWPSKEIKNRRK